jgi:glutathione peroxidase
MTLYDFEFSLISGEKLDWNAFKGKKVLLVNVASQCGLTPQYAALQALMDYFEKEFTVLGVPCNDFAGQEPGSPEEIVSFCSTNYAVTFPLTEKIHVLGEQQHPLYDWLEKETGAPVAWNFQKYSFDEQGNFLTHYSPQTLPNDEAILNWIGL